MDVREWRDEIVFLHKVRSGAADRSYGIQVAKLAGLPKPVTKRAAEVLTLLEKSDGQDPARPRSLSLSCLCLRPATPKASSRRTPSPRRKRSPPINPDELTPKAALEILYKLKDWRRNMIAAPAANGAEDPRLDRCRDDGQKRYRQGPLLRRP